MLFNSYIFILIFLPITLMGYYALLKYKMVDAAKSWLFLASMFFYGYWNMSYLALILSSIIVNFTISNLLISENKKISRKAIFIFALFFNIGLLSFFKYMDFFIGNINYVFGTEFNLLRIILPLGISFFTLQQVAFIVDVYEGLAKEKRFIDYSLFVSFFPQLIAGPIVHYGEVMPQFESTENKKFISKNIAIGVYIFTIGLFKKVMLADTFAGFATPGFDEATSLHFFSAWGTSLSYAFQLYFDFSGYSDMAIGLGYLFNIKLPTNFNSPLRATNVIDFWARWHITLTNFITTYVFTPLVRVMPKMNFTYMMLSMFVAMTIAGLWHGAAWTFVLYGMLHGGAIVTNHLWKKTKIKMPKWLAWFLTFNFINISFIIFRAKGMSDAFKILKGMFGLSGLIVPKGIVSLKLLKEMNIPYGQHMSNDENLLLLMLFVCLFIIKKSKNSMELLEEFQPTQFKAISAGFMFVLCLFGLNRLSEFIYFNF